MQRNRKVCPVSRKKKKGTKNSLRRPRCWASLSLSFPPFLLCSKIPGKSLVGLRLHPDPINCEKGAGQGRERISVMSQQGETASLDEDQFPEKRGVTDSNTVSTETYSKF